MPPRRARGRPPSLPTKVYRIPDKVWDNPTFKRQLFKVWAQEAIKKTQGDWMLELVRVAERVGLPKEEAWQYLDNNALKLAIRKECVKLTTHLNDMMSEPLFIYLPPPSRPVGKQTSKPPPRPLDSNKKTL